MRRSIDQPSDVQPQAIGRHVVAAFFIKLCVIYGVWLAAWPWTQNVYRAFFRQVGQSLLHKVGNTGRVKFTNMDQVERERDTLMILENTAFTKQHEENPVSARYLGYLPTGFTIALVLATPTPWHRRLWSLFLGVILIQLFITFQLWLGVLWRFSGPATDSFFIYHPGTFWRGALDVLRKVLAMSPVTAYIAPVFIWLLVSFRVEDLTRILGGRAAVRTATP